MHTILFVLFALSTGALGQSLHDDQLARFKEKIQHDIANIPNYTCLETVERARRDPGAWSLQAVDTVRLEVSSVAGNELFAWPGSSRFEDQDVSSLMPSGTIGTGMFAAFSHHLFVTSEGNLQYDRKDYVEGRHAVRYRFHLTKEESNFVIRIGTVSAAVAATGVFWFDPISLDLMRWDLHGEAMPDNLGLKDAIIRVSYGRMHIGATAALLPKRSELTMVFLSGAATRDEVKFSQCHEYHAESTVSFEPPRQAAPEVPRPRLREVDLPTGLLLPVELETAIDSKTAAVGDALRARVGNEVWYEGNQIVPRGAAVIGRIRRLQRPFSSAPYFAVGIEFSDIAWEDRHARPYAELVDLDRAAAGMRELVTYRENQSTKFLTSGEIPGTGVFYINDTSFRVAPGLHMLWRTLAHSNLSGRPH